MPVIGCLSLTVVPDSCSSCCAAESDGPARRDACGVGAEFGVSQAASPIKTKAKSAIRFMVLPPFGRTGVTEPRTRTDVDRGLSVPDVLLSGHKRIADRKSTRLNSSH